MASTPRLRPPRKIRPGASGERRPGSRISCAVLSAGPEEWVAVDLDSGAFVRTRPASEGTLVPKGEWAMFDVAVVELGIDDEPPDPSRPEAVAISSAPERAGRLSRRAARRMLHRLVAPEQTRLPILGTRGPSIAYVDLDVASPSLVLITTSPKSLRCYVRETGDVSCSFEWAGTTQALPLLDEQARELVLESSPRPVEPAALASAVGGVPGYLLVGLAAVRGGHAPKAVLSILAKRPAKR
ncbi:MAG: hypothetical protein JWO62_3385 [Acidimicrobiaceae bacterium]|jgi:hypothetical protein|nr:hypothetical protein [Acidimicrobiaceae bacterium]